MNIWEATPNNAKTFRQEKRTNKETKIGYRVGSRKQ